MSVDAVMTRWQGFLAKVRERADAVMAESVAGCAALLQQTGGDPQAMTNAWTGMRIRALQLGTKIQDTWDESVDDALDDADCTSAQRDAAWQLGRDAQDAIEDQIEATETKIFADAARELFRQSEQERGQMACSQCGGPIESPFSFRAQNVACAHCQAINTVEPGSKARLAEAMGSHHLCNEAAWSQWQAMKAAERRMHAARTATVDLIKGYEGAQIDYWTAYLQHRMTLIPERRSSFDADLRGKMRQFYESLEHEKAWVQAGRPRALA